MSDDKVNKNNMMYAKIQAMEQSRKLEMNDTFNFGCSGCGACCYGHDDIVLSGHDIFRIAQKLNIPTTTVLKRYVRMYVGCDSKMPVAMMGMTFNGACPLLSRGRCLVHDHKPATCALFPIGRAIDSRNKQLQYFIQGENSRPESCHSTNQKYTLREWLESFNLLDSDKDIFAWYDAIFRLHEHEMIKAYTKYYDTDKFTPNTKDMIWQAVTIALYVKYDMSKPFAEQLNTNVDELCQVLDGMHKMYGVLFGEEAS